MPLACFWPLASFPHLPFGLLVYGACLLQIRIHWFFLIQPDCIRLPLARSIHFRQRRDCDFENLNKTRLNGAENVLGALWPTKMDGVDQDAVRSGVDTHDQTKRNLVPPPFLSLAMESSLTTGIVAKAFNAVDPDEVDNLQPTVQLLSVKKVPKTGRDSTGPDRYRIIVSDGVQFIQAMLATQLNDLVESGQIRRNVIVRLTRFAPQNISAKRWAYLFITLNR